MRNKKTKVSKHKKGTKRSDFVVVLCLLGFLILFVFLSEEHSFFAWQFADGVE